jgi:hypothetical protein
MSAFEANIAAIEARFPEFARDLALAERAPLEPFDSRSGEANARFRGYPLHSAYAPRAEARKLALSALARAPGPTSMEAVRGYDSVAALGFGLGYLIEEFLSMAGGDGPERVLVIEPELGMLRAALELRDLRAALSNERLGFATGIQAAFKALDVERARSVAFAATPGYASVFPDRRAEAEATIRRFNARETVNSHTLERFGARWTANLARNAAQTVACAGTERAEGRLRGVPALVLAAGPSLDEALPRIRDLAARAVLVCVDTALRAVLRSGVEPDFVVVSDPQYWNSKHLDGCSAGRAILVADGAVWPSVFRMPRGGTLLYASQYPLGRLIEPSGRGRLGAGGSVATTAWDFARCAGCDPIYLAGLDLGFPGKKTHASGSYFERKALFSGKRLSSAETFLFGAYADAGPKRTADNSGGVVVTDGRMALYAWWFESRMARHPETRTRNLAARGVAIPGMPYAPLEEVLGLPERRAGIDEALAGLRAECARGVDAHAAAASRRALESLIERLSAAASLAQRAEAAASRAISGSARPSPGATLADTLSELDAIDAALSANDAKDLIAFLAPTIGASAGGSGGGSRGALERSLRFYAEIRQGSLSAMRILKRALPTQTP